MKTEITITLTGNNTSDISWLTESLYGVYKEKRDLYPDTTKFTWREVTTPTIWGIAFTPDNRNLGE